MYGTVPYIGPETGDGTIRRSLFLGMDNDSLDVAFQYGALRRPRILLIWLYRLIILTRGIPDDCCYSERFYCPAYFNPKAAELSLSDYKPGDKLVPFSVVGEWKVPSWPV